MPLVSNWQVEVELACSGDLGSFASFVSFMKNKAAEKDVDLLLIDSGDLRDGNGLTDEGDPGSVKGHDAIQYAIYVHNNSSN
jgi:2',3'-cyclic-nucleotide 2'-phosphodiesterase (5'-nucleotidase family)